MKWYRWGAVEAIKKAWVVGLGDPGFWGGLPRKALNLGAAGVNCQKIFQIKIVRKEL